MNVGDVSFRQIGKGVERERGRSGVDPILLDRVQGRGNLRTHLQIIQLGHR